MADASSSRSWTTFLEQVSTAFRASLEERERIARVGELAQDDYTDLGMLLPKLGRDPDALVVAGRRHPDIDDHDIGILIVSTASRRPSPSSAVATSSTVPIWASTSPSAFRMRYESSAIATRIA